MKKNRLLIAIAITLVSFNLVGCNRVTDVVNNYVEVVEKEVENDSLKTIKLEEENFIDIELGAGSVNINLVDDDKIVVKTTGNGLEYKKISLEKSGDKIKLQLKNKISLKNINFKSEFKIVVINIPKKFHKDMKIKLGAGNVNINDLTLENLDIHGGAGNLVLNNIEFKNLKLDQGVGNASIVLERPSGNIDLNGGVGKIDLSIKEVGGNLSYKGGVGKASIDIPEKSPVKISTSSGLGDVKVNASTSGEFKYIFDLKIGVGNVYIE